MDHGGAIAGSFSKNKDNYDGTKQSEIYEYDIFVNIVNQK